MPRVVLGARRRREAGAVLAEALEGKARDEADALGARRRRVRRERAEDGRRVLPDEADADAEEDEAGAQRESDGEGGHLDGQCTVGRRRGVRGVYKQGSTRRRRRIVSRPRATKLRSAWISGQVAVPVQRSAARACLGRVCERGGAGPTGPRGVLVREKGGL